MVVTIREVKTCERCGERQVVSENKEVTAIRSAAEVGVDEDDGAGDEVTHPAVDGDESEDDEEFEPPESAEEDDGVILENEGDSEEREPGAWPDHDADESATASAADGSEEAAGAENLGADEVATEDEIHRAADDEAPTDAVEDDAEFIDADEAEAAGDGDEPVAWPEHDHAKDAPEDESEAGEPAAWPEQTGEDEGFSAENASDDEAYDGAEVSFGGGLTPETESESEGEKEGYDAEFVGTDDEPDDAGGEFARAERPSVELETQMAGDPTEYFCPNCGYTRDGVGSSMRAGDICPECQQGYIAERET